MKIIRSLNSDRVENGVIRARYRASQVGLSRRTSRRISGEAVGLFKEMIRVKNWHLLPTLPQSYTRRWACDPRRVEVISFSARRAHQEFSALVVFLSRRAQSLR